MIPEGSSTWKLDLDWLYYNEYRPQNKRWMRRWDLHFIGPLRSCIQAFSAVLFVVSSDRGTSMGGIRDVNVAETSPPDLGCDASYKSAAELARPFFSSMVPSPLL